MIAVGGGVSVELALPPEGVDIRAELVAHQNSRIDQALARSKGDTVAAAKLLGVTALELSRMQAGHIAVAAVRRPPPEPVRVDEIPRVEQGVAFISMAAIRRLSAEGRSPQQIAKRLGCNQFFVQKVLRIEQERAIRRLKSGGMEPEQIALRFGITLAAVQRALAADPELAKCGATAAPVPSPARDRWSGV